ncbi:MAG: isoprenylcysteine carboxylmethyltransferase family protein [Calditrichaeota bacterium]|nr:isoprenylcysteine carboxylmethyltransferase family protein [Calditrichota bacterium]
MKTPAIFFLTLALLYFLQDILLRWLFRRKYDKTDTYIGRNAPNEMQRYFGNAIYFTLIYYLVIFIYLIADFDFWGLVHNISRLDNSLFHWIGFIFGIISIFLMTAVRLNLGESWRVGLDYQSSDDLITTGFYKYVRNPYFLFLLCFQFSLILIVPNAIMIASYIQSILLLGLQIRQEEMFLTEKYGNAYLQYKTKTGRYFPLIKGEESDGEK